ncbi:MAG: cation:proton antiporter [Bacteroidota bacterium]|nr:cation:proton antiporter [Bacteroidota bacterium]
MNHSVNFSLPFTDPVLIFTLVLLVILLAPIVLRKFRIPSIIGLILAGILIGPNGFNLLLRDSSIVLFGTVGLLYIMFLAGLEIDMVDFKKHKNRSIVFGSLTFFIPMILGTTTGYYFLEFSLISSILLASMFASHTLLAYPIVSRFGITKNQAVTITVGGTIITDTAALLVLAVIASATTGVLNHQFWIQLGISLIIFLFLVLWVFPRIGSWFFKNIESEGGAQFIFVLAIVFASAFLAQLAGIEPIIGAFMAGLALNRLIPHTSPLMNRVEFVGNNIFIPFFLISVGMLVDLRVIFKGPEALIVAISMIVVAIVGKWLAAFFTQKIFKYTSTERNIIFGLSNAQAAATLAAVLVGFNIGLFNEDVLNGTILMILVTCLVSSFVAENAGRQLAIIESDKMPNVNEAPERILVPISNPNSVEFLIDLALMIKNPSSTEPIYPLSVVKDDVDAREKILISNKMLSKAIKHAAATESPVQLVTRVDLNIASGILRAIKELIITEVVMGWNGQVSATNLVFGSVLDKLLQSSEIMVLVTKILKPLNVIKTLVVAVTPNAEVEPGFLRWIKTLKSLSKQTGANIVFHCTEIQIKKIRAAINSSKPTVETNFKQFDQWEDFLILSREVRKDDLLIIISSRKGSISYNGFLDKVPKHLSKHFQEQNFVILYPEQKILYPNESVLNLEHDTISPIQENMDRLNKLGRIVKGAFKGHT